MSVLRLVRFQCRSPKLSIISKHAMTTRKRLALIFLATGPLAALGCCCAVSPPIMPAVPPREFQQIREGMPSEEVKALFPEPPTIIDDGKKNDEPIAPPRPRYVWMQWFVHDGSILVQINERGLVEQFHFQASRSSVLENIQELWSLRRWLF